MSTSMSSDPIIVQEPGSCQRKPFQPLGLGTGKPVTDNRVNPGIEQANQKGHTQFVH
jgi:hypothetical protein